MNNINLLKKYQTELALISQTNFELPFGQKDWQF